MLEEQYCHNTMLLMLHFSKLKNTGRTTSFDRLNDCMQDVMYLHDVAVVGNQSCKGVTLFKLSSTMYQNNLPLRQSTLPKL